MLLYLFEQVERDQTLRSEMTVQSSPSSHRTDKLQHTWVGAFMFKKKKKKRQKTCMCDWNNGNG